MELTKEMRVRYFHEYVIARAFENLNNIREGVSSSGFSKEAGQRMHDEIVSRLQPDTGDLGVAKAGEFARVVNEVMGAPLVNRDTYNVYATDFARYTGFALRNAEQVRGATVGFQSVNYVPVSPFDTRLQYPDGEHANEILYVSLDQAQNDDFNAFNFNHLENGSFVSLNPRQVLEPAVESQANPDVITR